MKALQFMYQSACLSDLKRLKTESCHCPTNKPPPPFTHCCSSYLSVYLRLVWKIDKNLPWDYVLWATNNVEEPPGLPLPEQRCNKARGWEIHGYLIDTEAVELLCYIYRLPLCLIFIFLFLHFALVCLAYPPVSHLGGDLASAAACDSPATSHAIATKTHSARIGTNARATESEITVFGAKSESGLQSAEQVTNMEKLWQISQCGENMQSKILS